MRKKINHTPEFGEKSQAEFDLERLLNAALLAVAWDGESETVKRMETFAPFTVRSMRQDMQRLFEAMPVCVVWRSRPDGTREESAWRVSGMPMSSGAPSLPAEALDALGDDPEANRRLIARTYSNLSRPAGFRHIWLAVI